MKKLLLILMVALTVPVMAASLRQMQVQFVDEFGDPVTTITSITVFNSGLGTSPTIFNDRAGTLTVTNPITTSSNNSTFDQSIGLVRWFQQKPTYKLTVTDGSKTLTIDSQDEGDTRFPWYDNYIGTAASLSVGDNESITVGTDSDMVLAWNNGSGFMSWIPAADGSAFNLGTSGTTANVDFNWFVGTALGIKGDEGAATLVIDGLTTSINASSNFATNINTGTSTGAVTIGSSTAGAIAIDTDTSVAVNADDSYALTVSAGTIGIAATGGDITIDGTDSSVIVRGTEEASDAVSILADGTAGGIVITSGTGDITLTSTDDIVLTNATAAGDVITLLNTAGTSVTEDAAAIQLTSTAGGISIQSDGNLDDAIVLRADGGVTAEITVHNDQGTAEDSIELLSDAGGIAVTYATAKNMSVTGGQFIFTSNEDVASAFSVITNTGTSETITIVNTLGSGASAIQLDAKAGAVDINATGATDGDMTVDVGDDYTVTVAGDYTLAVTGTTTLPGNQLRRVVKDITADQMDNLAGTQIELVASPGASAYLEFVSAVFALDWNSVAWTEPSAPDDLAIRYTDGSGAIVSELLDATGFATATADSITALAPTADITAGTTGAVTVVATASVNKALVLDNTGSEWTNSGDSPVRVIVYYRVHTTTELGL